MDTKLEQGDHVRHANGQPLTLPTEELLLQRALICLSVPKGSFPFEKALGSRLYQLTPSAHVEQQALALAEEALYALKEVAVLGVRCRYPAPDVLQLWVGLSIRKQNYTLEVTI